MRAGRLVTMLLLLQSRGRMSAAQLAEELEVSRRTVLRDIEALSGSGVPVYSIRGAHGGFALMEHFHRDLPVPQPATRASRSRAHVRLSPQGRQLAVLMGRPPGLRIRRQGADGWFDATVVIESPASAAADLLSLGADVEVVDPPALRSAVARTARAIAAIYE